MGQQGDSGKSFCFRQDFERTVLVYRTSVKKRPARQKCAPAHRGHLSFPGGRLPVDSRPRSKASQGLSADPPLPRKDSKA